MTLLKLFIMTILFTAFYCLFSAVTPHSDRLMHSVLGMEIRTVREGFQKWKMISVFLETGQSYKVVERMNRFHSFSPF